MEDGLRIARFSVGDDIHFGVVEGPAADAETETIVVLDGDPLYRPVQPTGQRYTLPEVRLLAPIIPRSKLVCVGRNYADHAAELGNEVPESPLIFLKPNTSVVGPYDGIIHPPETENLQFEGELGVVIGRICRHVPVERVNEVIFGYVCANDVTARDLQKPDGQWWRAKGSDTFCPLGPWIATDLDADDLSITTTLNGETRQSASTSQLVFDIPYLISYVSSAMTLLPGDVLLTGTPAGVARMVPGDEVSVTVEGIGTLTNKVIGNA